MASRKDKILGVLVGIFLLSLVPGLVWVTFSKGQDSLKDLSVEYGYCENAGDCPSEATDALVGAILETSKYTSKRQVAWCLGVDNWADTHVRRGGWLVQPMMWLGYKFCPTD